MAKKRTDKQRATAAEKQPRQFDRVAADIFRLADEAVQLAQAYAGNDSETAAALEQRLEDLGIEAAKARAARKKPFVLITVSGGVATIWEHPSVDANLVDWDNWYGRDPMRTELDYLRELAERLENRNDKALFLRQVQELEDRGVADEN